MNRLRIVLILISAAWLLPSCSNKTMTAEERASHVKTGKHYRINLANGNTTFIRVTKIEGTTIYGKMRSVDKAYYPLRDSTGEKIGTHPGSVNLNDAVSVKRRPLPPVILAVPISLGLFLLLGSLLQSD